MDNGNYRVRSIFFSITYILDKKLGRDCLKYCGRRILMNKQKRWLTVYCFLLSPFFLLANTSCSDLPENKVTTLTKVRVASVPAIVEAPTHIAYQNGYFKQQGLDVELTINPDGKTSLEQLLSGEIDIATVTGTPVVYSSLKGNDFSIFGNIDHSRIHFVVARKDRGINSIADLRGRKVTVMFGTSGQFFMDSLLAINNMSAADMEIVNLNGPAQVKAFEAGEVDAVFCWIPFPLQALVTLGDRAALLPSDSVRPCSWVIVTTKDFARNHPEIPQKFLRGLITAQDFIQQNRAQASQIYSKVSGVQNKIISDLFATMDFDLSLEHGLLLDLEDQARWVIDNGYVEVRTVPNYLNYIDTKPMQAVRPEATTIIVK